MASRTSATGVDAALRHLSAELENDVDLLVDRMLNRMRDQVPDFDVESRPELRGAEAASIRANLTGVIVALGSDRRTPNRPPTEAVEEAKVTARAGVPLESLIHTYRVGHAVVWEHAIDRLEEMNFDAAAKHAARAIGSRYLFDYVDAISLLVTREYMAERDRVMRTGIQRRVQLVRDVLAGAAVGTSDLGYDLDAEHVALIVDGPQADAHLDAIRKATGRSMMTVAVSDDVVWAWLGSRADLSPDFWKSLAELPPPDDTRVAIGSPSWGAEGFRESHAQAQASHQVASRISQPVVRYSDVALEATLMSDGDAARRFVRHELGLLAGEDERAATHRATLEAYLGTGMNASAASAVLKVSDRTIAYRIRRIEEILGRTVTSRSAELAAALRLRRIYGKS
ncbi:MAG: PucR family transcriptional regulator [Solirubrobacterales bacterium]